MKDETAREQQRAQEEKARRVRETLSYVSDRFAGIAQDAESDIKKLAKHDRAEAGASFDVDLASLNRAAVEKTPGFQALREKCRELDVDFSWQARSYRDIDMTDSHYTHEDIKVSINPNVPFQEKSSYHEFYDPPRSYGSLGP